MNLIVEGKKTGFLMLFLLMGLVLINGCGRKKQEQSSGKEMGKSLPETVRAEEGSKKMSVEKGDKVKVQYTGSLEDGTVFDKSKEEEPLEFIVGSGQLIPGFDKAVEKMKLNEEKKVTIKVEDAYGEKDETLIKKFPRDSLPENFKPEKGMIIRLQNQTGRAVPGTIIDVTEDTITIDLNHLLAGKNLIFDIKVVGID